MDENDHELNQLMFAEFIQSQNDSLKSFCSKCGRETSEKLRVTVLQPKHVPQLQQLCSQWFPVYYPNEWYDLVTKNATNSFFAVGIIDDGAEEAEKLVGCIVAHIKESIEISQEDREVRQNGWQQFNRVCYIMVIGVLRDYRRLGLGSFLVQCLIKYLESMEEFCKAIYLHVLDSNESAIRFYETLNFKCLDYLPDYYLIHEEKRDAYSFVR